MSQENVEVVRKPLRVRERTGRSFEQRLALRFPRSTAAYIRLIGKRPPRSRLRQVALWRGARDGVEAWNRRDLDALLIAYHTDCEHYPPREFVEAGLWEPCYRGRHGYMRLMASWWDTDTAAHIEPIELLDRGTHVVLLSELSASPPRLAGVPLTRTYASVWTLQNGKIRTVRDYTSHDAALEAVGLSE
jgi:ketosteroid isomerase-like protein